MQITLNDFRKANLDAAAVRDLLNPGFDTWNKFVRSGSVPATDLRDIDDKRYFRVLDTAADRELLDTPPKVLRVFITMRDVRAAKGCGQGSKMLAKQLGFDWEKFKADQGIYAHELPDINHPMLNKGVFFAMDRLLRGGK